jgi:hypothetical protein
MEAVRSLYISSVDNFKKNVKNSSFLPYYKLWPEELCNTAFMEVQGHSQTCMAGGRSIDKLAKRNLSGVIDLSGTYIGQYKITP